MAQLQQITQQTRGHGMPALQDITALFNAQNNSALNNVQNAPGPGPLPLVSGSYFINAVSAQAFTLPAPVAGSTGAGQDGLRLYIYSNSAFAHTISAPGLLLNGTGAKGTATFAANPGACLTLVAYGGKWMVLTATAITFL